MGEVVPAHTSPTLLPHSLALCCNYPVSKCPSASIVVTSTLRVKLVTMLPFPSPHQMWGLHEQRIWGLNKENYSHLLSDISFCKKVESEDLDC